MLPFFLRRFCSLLLVLAILPACLPAGVQASDSPTPEESTAQDATPGESEPGESEPDESEPDESEPDESEPDESEPDESEPGESEPDESEPDESEPDESEPDESEPDESEPDESEPDESEPGESEPDESEPDESEPDESEPDESEPDESEPDESEPDESEPDESEPDESEPDESEPDESEPGGSEPGESEPGESEPGESEPDESLPGASVPSESQPQESVPPDQLPAVISDLEEEEEIPGPGLFFGCLHAHSSLSVGTDSIETVFQQAAQTDGLDFFAVTDHSNSFDGQDQGEIGQNGSSISSSWARGKAAADNVTTNSFVGIFGYEMSWPSQMKIGHLSTFGTPGFQSWKQEPYREFDGALENYYDALASVPGSVSQFNHPGTQYGTFCDFDFCSGSADRAVSLLELDSLDKEPLYYFTKALDQGWHLAPAGLARTVVYAQSLTEADILHAFSRCRAYTTMDPDLEIMYSMDGFPMGSQLDLRHVGDRMDISISVNDPTDSAAGQVEVLTTGGESITGQTVSAASGTLSFSLPASSGYYFLRVTQPDGDIAVTAPIWVDAEEALGISGLSCETPVPVRNEPVELTLELYNEEDEDFQVDSLTILADGNPIAHDRTLTVIPGGSAFSHKLSFSCGCVGLTQITVRLSGSLDESPRAYEDTVTLSFHLSNQVTAIAADSGHGNAGLEDLSVLRSLALEENIRLTTGEEITPELLKDCRFLLVSAPARPFTDEFLAAAAEFAGYGGSLVICGQADNLDTAIHSAAELNRLLSFIGSSMRIQDDLAQDAVNNGGDSSRLFTDEFNTALPWCRGITADQVYRHVSGCTVDPGRGTWIAKGRSTTGSVDGDGDGLGGTEQGDAVLLACETLSGGGTVFAAGSLFLRDADLEEPKNIWDAVYANRSIGQSLLGIGGETIPLSTIREARNGKSNELFRVRGYVTAGTSNPYNTFPETLYLQDDTGGIAVIPFSGASIQRGTAMEVTGFASVRNGNRILKVSSWKVLNTAMYLYPGKEGNWPDLLNPDLNGGRLVQVEGKCLELYCREDNTLAGCLLEDRHGNLAKIKIEDYIFAGSDGENDLHETIRKGRTVRAMGLLHIDEYGDTVIRVRNCEEVVWVPPNHYWNPQTGDFLLPAAGSAMTFSMTCLMLLMKRKRI